MSYPPPPSDPHDPPSADPWATSTGDTPAPQPRPGEHFQPGHAAVPPPVEFDPYPPTSQFPASSPPGYQGYQQPAYGPPGTQPGYAGPPGYGPPPPGYQQPYETPKPKRNNTPLIAVLIAVTLLLCAGGVTSVVLLVNRATEKAQETIGSLPTAPPDVDVPGLPTELPTDLPTLPTDLPDVPGNGFGEDFEVEYEVTGDGPVSIVWVDAENGPQQQSDVSLPWRKKLTMQKPYFVSVTAVRADVEEGTIACSVKVDGEQVAEKEGTGRFTTASCSKAVS
ncbi:MmpS family transport accessory protein [Actinoplanes sp. RD1]|uniref:MmpS family transport accessory protein n=1 Tax=Actinoplanes sp. RD1 TaxID=3064538 RepID=UPI0027415D1F|nr:MmpS family transport accessory protein [Actinoplanes sp. RD1]